MGNFLTHLKLQGFKSFASKTDLELDYRIVGVVGPNGSGKSNIIDAIRWVLGEREAKNLRSGLLENLIFAGTSKLSKASLARVTLHFNNRNRVLPVDSEEVSISRRIDRSGTSQFFVNNQEVRLKDLISIFARARLGSKGLIIVGQGEADVFVRVNPKERREMIEEILGLKEYRLKKRTAEWRLKETRINMEKLEVKLEEIAPHLKFLRRQRNKWEKRDEVKKELHEICEKYFAYHYYRLMGRIGEMESGIEKLKKEKKVKTEKIKEFEEEFKRKNGPVEKISASQSEASTFFNSKLEIIRKKLEGLRVKQLEFEKKLIWLEAKNEFEKKQERKTTGEKETEYSAFQLLSELKSFIKEVEPILNEDNLGKMKGTLAKWLNRFRSFFVENKSEENSESNRGSVDKIEEIRVRIEEINKEIKENEGIENEILAEQGKKNQEFRIRVRQLNTRENERRVIENQINEKKIIKERVEFQLRELENKWRNIGYNFEELRALKKIEIQGDENWDEIERRINQLQLKLSAIGEIDKSLLKEANETEARYELMTSEFKDIRNALNDLEKLIKNLEERIHKDFRKSFSLINKEFNNYFRLMFRGGGARLKLVYPEKLRKTEDKDDEGNNQTHLADENIISEEEREIQAGVEISLNLPKKKVKSLDMLSGGEKTLVSLAALFALIAVSPPPFLVLDEIDAALDDDNAQRFSELIKDFSEKTQFIIVTHNKVTMESMDTLYGITMGSEGVSKVLSLKLEEAERVPE